MPPVEHGYHCRRRTGGTSPPLFCFEVSLASQQHVEAFLEARRQAYWKPQVFSNARRELLASDEADVTALFKERLKAGDEDERCRAIEGLVILYGARATDTILPWIHDSSPTVRYVTCGCLHDRGDQRAIPALLDRMKNDADCQVRGAAASALGQIGSLEVLPHLHRAYRTDLEVDQLGYSPSFLAEEAMTSVLRRWITGQIAGTPPKSFRETTSTGQLTGTVTAEAIPFDPEGRITQTARYSHVPISAFGPGWSSKLNLQTTLVAPFEIEVMYNDPICVIERIFTYCRIENSGELDWAVHTIRVPTAMKARPKT